MRLDNTLKVFDLLVNTLIVNVNQDTASTNSGVYANVSIVGFALTRPAGQRVRLRCGVGALNAASAAVISVGHVDLHHMRPDAGLLI